MPVTAQAADPNGNPLTYVWQGCAAGTGVAATCAVAALGQQTATVTVTDSKGASATASVNVEGTNSGPTVTINGPASCHPTPNTPCTASLSASGSDPDGDALTYAWSGCASGSGSAKSCQVTGLSTFASTVTVSDAWSATGQATKSVQGTNQTPDVGNEKWTPHPIANNTFSTLEITIADDDTAYSACSVTRVFRNCTQESVQCSGRELVVTVKAGSGGGTGLCTVDFRWKDPWGAEVVASSSGDTVP